MNWFSPDDPTPPRFQPGVGAPRSAMNRLDRRRGGASGPEPTYDTRLAGQSRRQSAAIRARTAPARTERQARLFPREKPVDPMQALLDMVAGAGSYSGGSGGSPGNGAAINALIAQLNKNKEEAAQRYSTNRAQVTDIYGQLRDAVEPNAGYTNERYTASINAANEAGEGIANEAREMAAEQNAQRDAAFQSLGITPGLVEREQSATTEGLADLAAQNSTWGNMMGVLNNAQQSRDRLDVQGAADAGVLAERELLGNYEDYLRGLDAQIADARSQYVAPSGGSGGSYSNPLADSLNELMFNKFAMEAGLIPDPNANANAFQRDFSGFGGLQTEVRNRLSKNQPISGADLNALIIGTQRTPQQIGSIMGLLGQEPRIWG